MGCENLSYSPQRHGILSDFKRDDEFPLFEKQYLALLDEFAGIARDYDLDDGRIQLVKMRLFDVEDDFYGGLKEVLFGQGKQSLEKFVALLADDAIPFMTRRTAAANLIESMGLCAEGTATHMAIAANDLALIRSGDEVYRYKEAVIKQIIREFVDKSHLGRSPSMQIHGINRISNALADRFGLALQKDRWTKDLSITAHDIEACGKYILDKLTPASLVRHFAENCLSEFTSTMQSCFRDAKSGDSAECFDYARFSQQFTVALIPLQDRYGSISLRSLGSFDGGETHFRIYKDPVPLAREILASLTWAGQIEGGSPRHLYDAIQGDTAITIESEDGMIWATEDGQPVPLTAEHLRSIVPDKSMSDHNRVVATVIRNSSTESLIENLSPEWLGKVSIEQLLLKTGFPAFMRFAEKHQAFLEQKFSLGLPKIIVKHGDAAAFKKYMAGHPTLFAANDAMGIVNQFWFHAGKGEDLGMLEAVADVVMRHITPETKIHQSFLKDMSKWMRDCLECPDKSKARDSAVFISLLGNIFIKARENNLITSPELASHLLCDESGSPGLHMGLAAGNHQQLIAYREILSRAADKGFLDASWKTELPAAFQQMPIAESNM
ncbi:hypothetical protein D9O50_09940 [Oxalobacteraceae bacterium CAVE-383]|nr:hypothetical protein D9O50_09940 [Oxalobacteraceae bacterium CAVE-383]